MEIIDNPNWNNLDYIGKRERFYLPMTDNDLINALMRAYNAEVVARGNKMEAMPMAAIEKGLQRWQGLQETTQKIRKTKKSTQQ